MTFISDVSFTIFAEIQKLNPQQKIFTNVTGEDIDNFYLLLYDNRRCLDNFDSVKLAKAFNQIYATRWDSAFEMYQVGQSTMGDLGVIDIKTVANTGDYTDVESTTTKRPAYNEDTAQLDELYERNLTHTDNTTKTTTTVNRDLTNFETANNFFNSELFRNVVFKDVNDIILYPIINYNEVF